VNFKRSGVLVNRAAVGMVRRGVVNVVKRFACHSDYVRFDDLKDFVRLDGEGKFCVGPTEYDLANLAPTFSRRDFDADSSLFRSARIRKGDVNIAVGFNSHVNNAAREFEPLLLDW